MLKDFISKGKRGMQNEIEICFKQVMSSINLQRQSITTMIILKRFDFGRPKTKSMDMSSQTCVGIGNGYKRPAGDKALYFDF